MSVLTDRVAIVTGAGHGIGQAIAVALAQAGADVAAVDIDKAAAEKTAAAVAAAGRRSLALATDVGDVASIDQMVSPGRRGLRPHRRAGQQRRRHPPRRTSWISPRPTGTASCGSTARASSSACSAWPAR